MSTFPNRHLKLQVTCFHTQSCPLHTEKASSWNSHDMTWSCSTPLLISVGSHICQELGSYSGMDPQQSLLPKGHLSQCHVSILLLWSVPLVLNIPWSPEDTLALLQERRFQLGPVFTSSQQSDHPTEFHATTSQGQSGDQMRTRPRDPGLHVQSCLTSSTPFSISIFRVFSEATFGQCSV